MKINRSVFPDTPDSKYFLDDLIQVYFRSREKNKKIALRRLHDAVDAHLNGEESVSRQVARLEAEQKRWRKEQRAKVREEKAAAKQRAKEEEEAASEAQGKY